jgi:hypothetical protein
MEIMKLNTIILLRIIQNIFFLFIFNKKQIEEENEVGEEDVNHDLLCRFVTDSSGKKIGESVSIDEDIMIIKSGAKFLGVPLKHIKESKKNVIVKGILDFDKAFEMGEKWRKASFSEMEEKLQGNDDEL